MQRKAAAKRDEADRRFDEAKAAWAEMSEAARRMRPELDPELVKPRWRR